MFRDQFSWTLLSFLPSRSHPDWLASPACHNPRCPENMSFPFRGAPLYWVAACGHLPALLLRAPVISLHGPLFLVNACGHMSVFFSTRCLTCRFRSRPQPELCQNSPVRLLCAEDLEVITRDGS